MDIGTRIAALTAMAALLPAPAGALADGPEYAQLRHRDGEVATVLAS
jgi:hypothetical protein